MFAILFSVSDPSAQAFGDAIQISTLLSGADGNSPSQIAVDATLLENKAQAVCTSILGVKRVLAVAESMGAWYRAPHRHYKHITLRRVHALVRSGFKDGHASVWIQPLKIVTPPTCGESGYC